MGRLAQGPAGWRRRTPETTALHLAVRRHTEGFLASFPGLSPRVRGVLERFLSCGMLGAGFVMVRCETCKDSFLVAWSCKDKSFCPSCAARRMTEIAARWRDEVLPHVAWRQWVLTVPFGLRQRMAWDREWLDVVLGEFHRRRFDRSWCDTTGRPEGAGRVAQPVAE